MRIFDIFFSMYRWKTSFHCLHPLPPRIGDHGSVHASVHGQILLMVRNRPIEIQYKGNCPVEKYSFFSFFFSFEECTLSFLPI